MDAIATGPIQAAEQSGGEWLRLLAIARIAARKGWSQYARHFGLPEAQHPAVDSPDASYAVRLREALEELGPTFIKFGQMLSQRHDIFPDELTSELGKLHDAARPFDAREARSIIERETGARIDELFATFEDAPLAAGSMAQVHCATLQDGARVVVKVQRPGIEATIHDDIAVLRHVAKVLDAASPALRIFNLEALVGELADTLGAEIDFTREGRNAERFALANAREESVCVPRIYWQASARRVLTMDQSFGHRLDDLPWPPAVARSLAASLFRLFLTQVFEHGVFHADPHAGNIFILPDGRFCFHDFGALGELSPRLQRSLRDVFLAIIARDAGWLVSAYLAMGGASAELDRGAFTAQVSAELDRYYVTAVTGSATSFAAILQAFVRLGRQHRIRLVKEIALLLRAFGELEALATTLNPSLDSLEVFRGYSARLLKHALTPEFGTAQLAEFYRVTTAAREALAEAPVAARRLLGRLERGEPLFDIRHQSGGSLERHLLHASNRLAFALIIASLVVSSAIVISADAGPQLYGLPVLGVLGFVTALVLGGGWAILALRSGKL